MKFNKEYFLVIIIGVIFSCNKNNTEDDIEEQTIPNTIEIIINDMKLPHEGFPHGVPTTYDWATNPRLGWGNNPPSDWFAMIPQGQVYADQNPVTASNTRIQIKNIQAWYLSKSDNQWKNWEQTSNITGAFFVEDFQDNINQPVSIRSEDTGGISVKLIEGFNFHFWSNENRVTINPIDINGIWISLEGRLILDNLNGVDDRDKANFLCNTGGDYWKNLTVEWDNFESSDDIGIGRFKYLSTQWKTFNMHSLTEEQLRENPPPF